MLKNLDEMCFSLTHYLIEGIFYSLRQVELQLLVFYDLLGSGGCDYRFKMYCGDCSSKRIVNH